MCSGNLVLNSLLSGLESCCCMRSSSILTQKFVDFLLQIFVLNKAGMPNFSEYVHANSLASGSSGVTTFVFKSVNVHLVLMAAISVNWSSISLSQCLEDCV